GAYLNITIGERESNSSDWSHLSSQLSISERQCRRRDELTKHNGAENSEAPKPVPNDSVEGVPKAGLEYGVPKAEVEETVPKAGVKEGLPNIFIVVAELRREGFWGRRNPKSE
ncbi:hypothetical protein ACH5RR_035476, partial [Cinchona calisaya]